MSGRRALWGLVAFYAAAVFVLPRYEADLLQGLVDSRALRQSEAASGWVGAMTYCDCPQGACACEAGCAGHRRLDWSSPHTVATGFCAGTFVLTPFVSRQLLFVKTYGATREGPAPASPPEASGASPAPASAPSAPACAPRHSRLSAWQVGALAATGMFLACLVNFALGAFFSLFGRGPSLGSRWSGLLDRWGLGVLAAGFLLPAGFPLGLASLYLGLRRANVAGMVAVAAIGSVCHVMVLMAAYDRLAQWLGA